MRFFVPGEEDAEAAWERMRQACGGPDTRPLFSITYDEGTEVVAMVGEEGVIAIIFGGKAFDVFEAPESPSCSVPEELVVAMVFCDD